MLVVYSFVFVKIKVIGGKENFTQPLVRFYLDYICDSFPYIHNDLNFPQHAHNNNIYIYINYCEHIAITSKELQLTSTRKDVFIIIYL
jgi:hypothetical protein